MKTFKRRSRPTGRTAGAGNDRFMSPQLREELVRFIEYHPARRFNRNLRRMLFEFLMTENAVESLYLKDLLYDLDGLFELLDTIEDEGT
ncbi:MAG TPA: hypothetical protein VF490_07230 [Chryseosolibacter sp.]